MVESHGVSDMDDVEVLPVPTVWAGHRRYGSRALLVPNTVAGLAQIVASGEPVRALGSRHSFSDLADSPGVLVNLARLAGEPRLVSGPGGEPAVEVSAGTTYAQLGPWLHEHGWALAALASLPHISVVGAIATGTHGSGDAIGTLSSAVVALDVLTASGEVRRVQRGDPDFAGAVVALGAIGIVLSVTLSIEPTYQVAQNVIERVPFAGVLESLGRVFASATSVSVFTTWDGTCAIWRKQRVDHARGHDGAAHLPADLTDLGGVSANGPRHPLAVGDASACTDQLGVAGPWFARLPHFRPEFTPSAGAEVQSEYLLPREFAAEAILAVGPLLAAAGDLVLVSELRSMAGDDLWLSGAYGRDTIGLHTTWRPDVPQVLRVLADLERALEPFSARPHWGKLFTLSAESLAPLYPRSADARALIHRWDPDGVFSGPFLERVGLRG